MQETWVRSLYQEDSLEKEMATCSSTLPIKVHLVKSMVFPAVLYACDSWTVKKAERRRIDAFELWCWEKTLEESLGLQGDPTSPF